MNNEERNRIVDEVGKFVTKHSVNERTNFEKQHTDYKHLLSELNTLYKNKIDKQTRLDYIRDQKEQILAEAARLGTKIDKEKYNQLIDELIHLAGGNKIKRDEDGNPLKDENGNEITEEIPSSVKTAEKNFNTLYNEARQFYKVDIRNGHIEGQDDTTDVWWYIHLDENGNPTYKVDPEKDESYVKPFLNKDDVYNPDSFNNFKLMTISHIENEDDITKTLNKIKNGEEITNADWLALSSLYLSADKNYNKQYNDLYALFIDDKFKYNIDRDGVNVKLVDVRNYHNFRSSNNDNAKIDLMLSTNYFYNPAKMLSSNASKSFYMSKNDFYWSLNYNNIKGLNYSVQNIILNLYQPILQYNIGRDIFSALDNMVGSGVKALMSRLGMGEIMQNLAGYGVGKAVESKYNDDLTLFSLHPEHLYNSLNYMKKSNPMYYILRLFNGGKWLNTYLLPFVSGGKVKTDYLQNSTQPGEWNIGGLIDKSGSLKAMSQTILHDRISISLPTSPTFAVSNPHNATLSPINIDFYLINKNDLYLAKNFQLMQALFAGTQWLSMLVGLIAATNVYHVIIPGRFQIHWASLLALFETAGKLRTNNYMYSQYANEIKMILYDTLWPLAWQVKLTIKPLTPWNFNTQMAYYLNGFGSAQKSRLYEASKLSILNKNTSLKSLNGTLGDLYKIKTISDNLMKNWVNIWAVEDQRSLWEQFWDYVAMEGGEQNTIEAKLAANDLTEEELIEMSEKVLKWEKDVRLAFNLQKEINEIKLENGFSLLQVKSEDSLKGKSTIYNEKIIQARSVFNKYVDQWLRQGNTPSEGSRGVQKFYVAPNHNYLEKKD